MYVGRLFGKIEQCVGYRTARVNEPNDDMGQYRRIRLRRQKIVQNIVHQKAFCWIWIWDCVRLPEDHSTPWAQADLTKLSVDVASKGLIY